MEQQRQGMQRHIVLSRRLYRRRGDRDPGNTAYVNSPLLEMQHARCLALSSLCSSMRIRISNHRRMHAIFSKGLMRSSPVPEPGMAVKYSASSGHFDGHFLGLDAFVARSGTFNDCQLLGVLRPLGLHLLRA
ncbi:hypothetical protein D0860_04910 [Hortaea werneckii]|uniref:Uncharacterized protein n=1 Tax=Hortaea werneckii TaxID=91943 RepID=A0A3M7H3T2_HORWE|nr:hypothetical protein D0860_04910 [Hortaea werneckii]RMZ26484.1 hypothetical protein D0859_09454 [Hortaea werneckii]